MKKIMFIVLMLFSCIAFGQGIELYSAGAWVAGYSYESVGPVVMGTNQFTITGTSYNYNNTIRFVDNVIVTSVSDDINTMIDVVSVYPIPIKTGEVLTVSTEYDKWELYNIAGALVKSGDGMIDTGQLPGLYVLRVSNKGNVIALRMLPIIK